MDEMYRHAVKLLAVRDYTESQLRSKLQQKFGKINDSDIVELIRRGFLDDRRFIRNFVARKPRHSMEYLRQALIQKGIDEALLTQELEKTERPSLHDVLKATMVDWNLDAPLRSSDAARLLRLLNRLGYEEEAIREELEPLHG